MAAEELLVFPGLEELVALRAVRDVEATGEYDVCVVDCAPTGSALRMLRLPDVFRFFMTHFFDVKRRAARLIRPIAERVGAGRLVAPDAVFDAFERLYADVEVVRQGLDLEVIGFEDDGTPSKRNRPCRPRPIRASRCARYRNRRTSPGRPARSPLSPRW